MRGEGPAYGFTPDSQRRGEFRQTTRPTEISSGVVFLFFVLFQSAIHSPGGHGTDDACMPRFARIIASKRTGLEAAGSRCSGSVTLGHDRHAREFSDSVRMPKQQ